MDWIGLKGMDISLGVSATTEEEVGVALRAEIFGLDHTGLVRLFRVYDIFHSLELEVVLAQAPQKG
jgi:hypothetical protein